MAIIQLMLSVCLLMFISATHGQIKVRLEVGVSMKGTKMSGERVRTFYAFRGIPYAEPPERFQAPVPKILKDGDKIDATKDGSPCLQMQNNTVIGSENCLYLNVYTPSITKSGKAVMVFVHGGFFEVYSGTSAMFPPERFMGRDIVLVTMNYRLNAFGFLSTQDGNSPGNYGLMDQALALKWVKDHIKAFSGDPEQITVFGQSSGAASVSYHLLSPMSKGLFQQAIAMSGSSLCTWAFEKQPLRWAKTLATQIGCPTNSTDIMVECFKKKPASDLLKPIPNVRIPFPPTVDGKFLTGAPIQIMSDSTKLNKVNYMSGVTEEDGLQEVWEMIMSIWNAPDSQQQIAKMVLSYMTQGNPKLISLLQNQYLSKIDQTNKYEVARALVQAYSDGTYRIPQYMETQLLTKAGLTVRVYQYNYEATNIPQKVGERATISNASSNGEELYMLFDKDLYNNLGKLPLSETDYQMAKVMNALWRNFANTGHPGRMRNIFVNWKPEWNPSSPQILNIQQLDQPMTKEVKDLTKDETYRFWIEYFAAMMNPSNSTA